MNKRLTYYLGNSKGLRSPMTGAWDIHQIALYLYYTTQTQWGRERQPLQYSCLENPMDRGGRWVTVLGGTDGHD